VPTLSPKDLDKPLKRGDLDELDALAEQYDFAFRLPGLKGFFAELATAPTLVWSSYSVSTPR
jgi:hypothetical protein